MHRVQCLRFSVYGLMFRVLCLGFSVSIMWVGFSVCGLVFGV